MDDDGLTTPGYTYQWIRVATDTTEANIATATASTYTLVTEDLGTTIKVKVSFTDDASNAETLTSVATAAVAAAITDPTAVPNNWSLTPTGLAGGDQFRLLFLSSTKRNGSSTDIATYNTFIQNLAAAGHTDIRTYSAGFRAVGCTAAVDARDNTSTTGTGVPIYWLDGTKVADDYADFYDGDWDDEVNDKNESGTDAHDTSMSENDPITGCMDDGTESFAGAPRPRSLGATLGLVRTGRLNASGNVQDPIDGNDTARTTDTRPMYGLSAVFEATNAPATGAPTITGTAQVGQTLTAVTTAIMDDDGLTTPGYTYQWIRVATDSTETNIATATASTYTLVTDDLGTTIKVKVSFTDDASNAETRTSVATATVTAATTVRVLGDWSLIPTGVTLRDKFRLLFLSSTKRNGSSTNIADYNTFVQTRAAAGHADIRAHGSGFRAIGCTSAVDARDNTFTTYIRPDKGVPIYWLGGTKVADDYEDFYDGTWDDEVNDKNESGSDGPDTSQEANYPITGCQDDGTEDFVAHLQRALGSTSGFVRAGRPNSSEDGKGPIDGNHRATTTTSRPMYGLSQVFQVVDNTYPPSLTSATVSESGGTIVLAFSEDLQSSALPPTSAVTVTAGSTAVMVSAIAPGSATDELQITVSPLIGEGQTVVVDYADPTTNNDANAIQDTAGNDTFDFTTGSDGVPAVTNNSTVHTEVPANSSLIPTSLALGTKYRLLFLSSTRRDATASDIAVYNTFVQNLAAAGHDDIQAYSAGFRVIGCTSAVDARDNTATTYTLTNKGIPIYWLGGTKAADDYEDFYDGSWDDEVNVKNESGAVGLDTSNINNRPFTGCELDGTEAFAGRSSVALGGPFNIAQIGRPNSNILASYTPLSSNQSEQTFLFRPMYGLSEIFEVIASVPGAPTGLRATASGITQINLSWSAPARNGGSAIIGYRIEISSNGGSNWTDLVANTSGTGTTHPHTGLPSGSTRHYRVSAINAIGTGAHSNTDGATTRVPMTVPGAPTGLQATAGGITRINLSWSAPANNGGSAIIGYRIEISSDGGSNWTDLVANTSGTGTTHPHTGLPSGSTRHYRVSAINATGTGAHSNTDGATTGGGTTGGGGSDDGGSGDGGSDGGGPGDGGSGDGGSGDGGSDGGGSDGGGSTGGGTTGGGGGGGANRPPVVERQIPDQTITVGEVLELDITLNFYDRDQRALDYSVESADAAVATVEVDPQGVLTIQGVARGVTSVTLTAADRRDERASAVLHRDGALPD